MKNEEYFFNTNIKILTDPCINRLVRLNGSYLFGASLVDNYYNRFIHLAVD